MEPTSSSARKFHAKNVAYILSLFEVMGSMRFPGISFNPKQNSRTFSGLAVKT